MNGVTVYAKDAAGKLMQFTVNHVSSFAEAINEVKRHAGVERAMCLVPRVMSNQPTMEAA